MNKLSEKEIEAIRKRAEKATEGNWAREILCHEQRKYTVGSFKGDLTVIGDIANEEDAEFIVHAREDIPKLLAEIERYRETINNVLNQIEELSFVRGEPLYYAYYELLEAIKNEHK